jgi:hypothetical protein
MHGPAEMMVDAGRRSTDDVAVGAADLGHAQVDTTRRNGNGLRSTVRLRKTNACQTVAELR